MRKVVLTPELMHRVETDHRFRLASVAETYPDWREDALCIAAPDPDLFFPLGPEGIEPARRVCGRCPVAGQCLAEALGRAEIDGLGRYDHVRAARDACRVATFAPARRGVRLT